MRYILDQNMARDKELDEFLGNGNEIVLLNDFIVEPFKSLNYEIVLKKNFEILKNYPTKIFVAYERGVLLQKELATGHPIKKDDIIDLETSKIFRDHFLNNVSYNDFSKSIAKKRINEQENFVEIYIRDLSVQLAKELRQEDAIKIYKNDKNKRMNDIKETVFKLLRLVFNVKTTMNYNHEYFEKNISMTFCQPFVHVWRVIDWSLKNGAENAREAIRGDGFDIEYVVYSCFCDGIFTYEKWMKESREDLMNIFKI
jgi:hypothetical protein